MTLLLIGLCVWIYFFVQPSGQNTFMARTADEQAAEVEWTPTVRDQSVIMVPPAKQRAGPKTGSDLLFLCRAGEI